LAQKVIFNSANGWLVAAVPGSSFFRENVNNYIRFHFAKNPETLTEALKRLEKLRSKAREHYH
jgi:aspartate/methionine/tyrosine aminotransferase